MCVIPANKQRVIIYPIQFSQVCLLFHENKYSMMYGDLLLFLLANTDII
jgi:hypothetical protein